MKRLGKTAVRAARVAIRRRIIRSAAELAYFLILTFFPLLICINAAAGALNLQESDFYRLLAQVIPSQSLGVVEEYLLYVTLNQTPSLLIGGLILTITSSSAAFRSLLATVDDIYRRPHQSGIWFGIKSVLLSGLLLATVVVGMVILVTGEWFIALLDRLFRVGTLLESWTRLRFPLLFVFLLLMLTLFYAATAARRETGRPPVLRGAVFAAAGLVLTSILFSWFIDRSSRYPLVYGSLTSVIILMIWLYVCGNILLAGTVINYVADLEERGEEDPVVDGKGSLW